MNYWFVEYSSSLYHNIMEVEQMTAHLLVLMNALLEASHKQMIAVIYAFQEEICHHGQQGRDLSRNEGLA
jgi:hypothetical protein